MGRRLRCLHIMIKEGAAFTAVFRRELTLIPTLMALFSERSAVFHAEPQRLGIALFEYKIGLNIRSTTIRYHQRSAAYSHNAYQVSSSQKPNRASVKLALPGGFHPSVSLIM